MRTLALLLALTTGAGAADRVAVLHNTAAGDELAKSVKEYVDLMTEALRAAGIRYDVVDDKYAARRGLAAFRAVILPYNPRTPDPVDAAVAGFIAGGGKVLLFYERPTHTLNALGVQALRWIETRESGQTAAVRFKKGVLPGAVDFEQSTWNFWLARPGRQGGVAAEWLDKDGKPTGHPAVIVSPGGLYMSHVLFTPDVKKRAAFVKAALVYLATQKLPQADIAVWRNTHAERTDRVGDGRSVGRYLQNVRNALDLTGLPYQVISDEAVQAGALKRFKWVLLPLNPRVPRSAVRRAQAFVKAGGKLTVFYSCPGEIGKLLGISRTDLKRAPGMCHRVRVSGTKFSRSARRILAGVSFVQNSYHCLGTKLGPGAAVAGEWVDRHGKASEVPALVVSPNGLYMSHVLLAGDERAKARFLTGIAVHFLGPEVLPMRGETLARYVYAFGPVDSAAKLKQMAASVSREQRDKALLALREAGVRVASAEAALEKDDRVAAWLHRAEARAHAERAYCLAQPTKKSEGRGVWLHRPKYEDWDQVFARLAAGGINQIFPNLCSPVYADYKSDLLPPSAVCRERGDQLAQMLAAGKKHGIDVHVWMVNFYCMRASRQQMQRLLREGRLTLGRDGTRPAGQAFLCPSDPRNRKLIADVMIEITRKYHPAGIHFDYIRYHGGGECFCSRCKAQFAKAAGRAIRDWGELDRDPKLAAKWTDFRCGNISAVVADVAKRSRAIDPKVQISAAVFSEYPRCRRHIGQDWKLWIDRGDLDFVCPMNYTTDASVFERKTRAQMALVGKKVPVYPGVGSFRLPAAWRAVEQIAAARDLGAPGVTFFELNDVFLERTLPALAAGPFRAKAVPPHKGAKPDPGGLAKALLASADLKPRPDKVNANYKLGAADRIEIVVVGSRNLSGGRTVRADGWITVELIGDVHVAGRTPHQVGATLKKALGTYIRDVDVRVRVKEFKSQSYHVLGQAVAPGKQPYDGDVTVLRALVTAKGGTERAAWDRIQLIRGSEKPPQVVKVNVRDVLAKATGNHVLRAGDVLYVPSVGEVVDEKRIAEILTQARP